MTAGFELISDDVAAYLDAVFEAHVPDPHGFCRCCHRPRCRWQWEAGMSLIIADRMDYDPLRDGPLDLNNFELCQWCTPPRRVWAQRLREHVDGHRGALPPWGQGAAQVRDPGGPDAFLSTAAGWGWT